MARYDARACELGSARGCARLGDAYAIGHPGFAHDGTRAAQLWSMACDDGDSPACESAARAHHLARGVPRDDKRAQGYLDRACRLGRGSACGPLERVFGGRGQSFEWNLSRAGLEPATHWLKARGASMVVQSASAAERSKHAFNTSVKTVSDITKSVWLATGSTRAN
jgi:TPR repeat protein